MSSARDRDAVEFLPDAEAVRNAALPGWAQYSILWMAGFFAVFLLWTCLGQVDVIVTARGRIVSDHPTIVMKPLERTVVKRILVAVGDRVHAGQELVLFDPVFSRADMERLAKDVHINRAKYERLRAEYEGRTFEAPDPDNAEALVQLQLFESRRQFYADREAYYKHEMDRISKSKCSIQENLGIQRKRLAAMLEIEGIIHRGNLKGAVSQRELLSSQIERRQMDAEIRDKEHSLQVLDSELLAKKAEYSSFTRDWRIGIADELVKAEAALTSAQKEYAKAEQMTSYVALRAPEDAVVHEVMPVSVGSAVREAETLLTLVPLGGKLEAEAEIKADDIGRVREGDTVRVKVSAFPFQKYGTLDGRIRVISEDAFSRGQEEMHKGDMSAYYRARIAFTGTESGTHGILKRTIPGMEVEAEIKTGTRSIFSYFIYPLVKAFDESIREP
ncbi:MAG: HlyD family type I secretion periplasmic adaptor subunit [Desulfovibrio sp.]|nr:HlyD family type I secretion periplasmic adaptor subunit [Desulfovibrio sp.]